MPCSGGPRDNGTWRMGGVTRRLLPGSASNRLGNVRALLAVEGVMRSRLVALVAFSAIVWSAVAVSNAPSASACSCGPVPPLVSFEGTAQTGGKAADAEGPFGTDYEFHVERVISGDVQPSERVRVVTGAGSTCGIGSSLVRRGRYQINASVSSLPGGQRLLNVNLCSGSAELLAAPPVDQGPEAKRWPLVGVGAVAAGAAGLVLSRRRRRPSP